MKFIKNLILVFLIINCSFISEGFAYNLDNYQLIYENDTTITKNIFNGANVRCSSDLNNIELFYYINTEDNFATTKGFVEKEFSSHIPITLHKNGMKINVNRGNFISGTEELKEGKIVYTIKTVDISPNSKFPPVTLILNETSNADSEEIRKCINSFKGEEKDKKKSDDKKEEKKSTKKDERINQNIEIKNENVKEEKKEEIKEEMVNVDSDINFKPPKNEIAVNNNHNNDVLQPVAEITKDKDSKVLNKVESKNNIKIENKNIAEKVPEKVDSKKHNLKK